MKRTMLFAMVVLLFCPGLVFAAQKTMTAYMWAEKVTTTSTVEGEYVSTGTDGAITGSLATNDLSLGNNLNDSSGSYWYGGDSDVAYCIDGECNFGVGVRVYFDFIFRTTDESEDSRAQADGFMFSIVNGSNNSKTSTGGAPARISMGELMGYAGPGRSDGTGLRPPKFGVEFDTFPNGSGDICAASSRNDHADNHMALMFWGQDSAALTGNCSISGTNYVKHTFDDNRHAEGTGNNPTNSYHGDGSGGYYSVAKGSNTYNWLEDNQWHSYRMEVIRNLAPQASGANAGKYAYNIKAWVDCPSCTEQQLSAFQNLPIAFDAKTPQINRTVYLTAAQHTAFSTMLFGFTEATGGSTQTVGIRNFNVYFPRSECNYGISPVSVNYSNAAQTGRQVILYTGSTCSWNIVNSNSWITITSGTSGTGNATVTYNVAANTGMQRTGTLTIADQIFTITQEAANIFTITASAGANGTISPSGVVSLYEGSTQTYNITPSANYQITDVLVDGVSVGAVSSYTFTNVTANHTISATFAAIPCTLTIADNSFACKLSTGNNRVYIKVYLTNGAGSPVTDATVTYNVSGQGSGTLNNLGSGWYGGTRNSDCGLGNNTVRTGSFTGSATVTVTATRLGCTNSPLTKTMNVP